MALTETQAKVLAALAIQEPARTLTVRELCGHAGRAEAATRAALQGLADSGLAHGSRTVPVGWRITARGRSLINAQPYREFLPRNGAVTVSTNGAGQ
ncbi:helix-turn-helix domain-containing protein [Nocardia vinacea]|uniref:hypothetical protein n=1 Tax=Nocardia vinacea TaxID=96468 RepID=UPI002E0D3CD5|nr:helix-turn-helix domain-containing protein [Nocardia vinacea]